MPVAERLGRIAEDERKRIECPHCGRPFMECSDPDRVWYPYRIVCHASMEAAAANSRYDDLHEDRPFHDGTFKSWSQERSPHHPYHARDGVTIGVHEDDLSPDDDFLA